VIMVSLLHMLAVTAFIVKEPSCVLGGETFYHPSQGEKGSFFTALFSFNGGTGGMPYSPPPQTPSPGGSFSSSSSSSSSSTPNDPRSASNNKNNNNRRSSLILYGHPGSRSPMINWAAYELGLELIMGDLTDNPHPFGKVPCLTDRNGEIGIFESGAILQYLHNEYCQASSTRLSLSPGQAAALASWIVWANASLEPICFLSSDNGKIHGTRLRRQNRNINNNISPGGGGLEDIDRLDEILANVSRLQQRMPPGGGSNSNNIASSGGVVPGSYVPSSPPPPPPSSSATFASAIPSAFLLGSDFTLADVAVASYLLFALRFYPDTDLSRWPNIVKYLYTCASRKAYGRAFGPDVQESLLELLRGMSGGRELVASSLVLYGHPLSTSPAISWAGFEFGLDLVMGNLAENPHPYGEVPCLTDQNGKVMVFENSAILQYLQDHYQNKKEGQDRQSRDVNGRNPPNNSSNNSDESAQIDRWIKWAGITLEPICLMDGALDKKRPLTPQRQFLSPQHPKPLQRSGSGRPRSLEPRQDQVVVDFYRRAGIEFQALEELNRILGQNQQQSPKPLQGAEGRVVKDAVSSSLGFLVGEEFSLADVAVASLLLYIPQNFPGTNLSQWPYLVRYMKDSARRPAYARASGRDVQALVLQELENQPRRPHRNPPDDDDRRRNSDRRLFTPAYRI
jgi:glutathione S-transferase